MFAKRLWTDGRAQDYWTDPGFIKDAKVRAEVGRSRLAAAEVHDMLFPEGD